MPGFTVDVARSLPGPAWLTARRTAAAEQFADIALPTADAEEWRYSPIAELDLGTYSPVGVPQADGAAGVAAEAMRGVADGGAGVAAEAMRGVAHDDAGVADGAAGGVAAEAMRGVAHDDAGVADGAAGAVRGDSRGALAGLAGLAGLDGLAARSAGAAPAALDGLLSQGAEGRRCARRRERSAGRAHRPAGIGRPRGDRRPGHGGSRCRRMPGRLGGRLRRLLHTDERSLRSDPDPHRRAGIHGGGRRDSGAPPVRGRVLCELSAPVGEGGPQCRGAGAPRAALIGACAVRAGGGTRREARRTARIRERAGASRRGMADRPPRGPGGTRRHAGGCRGRVRRRLRPHPGPIPF